MAKEDSKLESVFADPSKAKLLENPGIDPGTSRMLSERSTI